MRNEANLIVCTAGFVGAIFLCSFFKIGITFSLFLIFISVILFIYRKFIAQDFEIKQTIFLIAIFALSFSVGIFRYELKDSQSLDANLENNVGNKVVISGVVSDEPTRKEKQAILIVDFKQLLEVGPPHASEVVPLKVEGKGIVSTDLYPEFKYGDLINISGKLEKPQNFPSTALGASPSLASDSSTTSNPSQMKSQFDGASSFDYVSYLGKDDIFYKIDFAKTQFVSSGHGNAIKSFLFDFKNSFISNLNKTISEPESSLLSGILIGAKSSMNKDTTEIFRSAGLSHIVALSGYNITVVANAITKTLSFLPKTAGFFGGIIGIILFVIMSGASSTAVRAGLMALIIILAEVTHRNYQAGRALIVAGLVMIIINPKILVFDISFELSFLATIAIIYISPVLKSKLGFITEKFNLRDTISSTISAQILVLPLILYKMGMLSLVALPANILVVGFIPATMLFGFITGVLGYFWLPIALPFAWISWVLLAYMIEISKFFADLPFSTVNISFFSFAIMIVYYIFVVIWIVYQNKKSYPTVALGSLASK